MEIASEFAVSEVFSLKKAPSGISSQATALASTDQLQDHDEAYTEGRSQHRKSPHKAVDRKKKLFSS